MLKSTCATEITKAAYELESYKQIMGVIARRLQDQGEDWRHVYKSLLLLEYMAKHGPQKVLYHLRQCIPVAAWLPTSNSFCRRLQEWALPVSCKMLWHAAKG